MSSIHAASGGPNRGSVGRRIGKPTAARASSSVTAGRGPASSPGDRAWTRRGVGDGVGARRWRGRWARRRGARAGAGDGRRGRAEDDPDPGRPSPTAPATRPRRGARRRGEDEPAPDRPADGRRTRGGRGCRRRRAARRLGDRRRARRAVRCRQAARLVDGQARAGAEVAQRVPRTSRRPSRGAGASLLSHGIVSRFGGQLRRAAAPAPATGATSPCPAAAEQLGGLGLAQVEEVARADDPRGPRRAGSLTAASSAARAPRRRGPPTRAMGPHRPAGDPRRRGGRDRSGARPTSAGCGPRWRRSAGATAGTGRRGRNRPSAR